ncbi:MAG: mechanosensitive ion channel [Nitrospira sp.]|nr:mechanosensitive ion channel [Nitrospira sp.]MCA9464297.1 mechanosensitive ion channel [Nitrospira sp.]MDR4487849.1 mechanosensitive ion channel family protein [Nitrospirales bacterium]
MTLLNRLAETLPLFLPVLVVFAFVSAALWGTYWFLFRREGGVKKEEHRFSARVAMLLLVGIGLVLILLALPLDQETHKDLFQLLALLITAVITLSSTTFVSNAMAGFMLRGMHSFRLGDFLKVENQFGRVTERGIFHTEIQTEERDLTTIPNLVLVSHPFTVIRSSGTIVSATVSLGYDTSHQIIEDLLIDAALAAKLTEPFVQVLELGDYSVTYRVAGFLAEVKQILSARSKLRIKMLTTLHEAGIEIVSPMYMNQRQLENEIRVLPPKAPYAKQEDAPARDSPESLIFDKADAVAQAEELREQRDALREEIAGLESQSKTKGQKIRPWIERRIKRIKQEEERLSTMIHKAEEEKIE